MIAKCQKDDRYKTITEFWYVLILEVGYVIVLPTSWTDHHYIFQSHKKYAVIMIISLFKWLKYARAQGCKNMYMHQAYT